MEPMRIKTSSRDVDIDAWVSDGVVYLAIDDLDRHYVEASLDKEQVQKLIDALQALVR